MWDIVCIALPVIDFWSFLPFFPLPFDHVIIKWQGIKYSRLYNEVMAKEYS